MVALKGFEIDKFLARPHQPVVLVFGPDAGLVRERAETLVRISVDDPKDPFQLARLDGDELAGEPTRLVEEANTIPLFGGRRAVWVKAGSRNIAPAVEALIACSSPDCRVVIEAAGLTISPDARSALIPLLGGDRLASRHEVQKLAMFARGKAKVELDDVMAV